MRARSDPRSNQMGNQVANPLAYELDDATQMAPLQLRQQGSALALQVVPLEKVVPHEHYHDPRVAQLAARLTREGKLINPPIVVRQNDQFVVLDGATRLTALRQLGYPHIIVQVVDFEAHGVQLTSWVHAVHGGSVAGLLGVLAGIMGLHLMPASEVEQNRGELPPGALGHLTTVDNQSFVLEVHGPFLPGTDEWHGGWLGVLNQMVEQYGRWGNVERTLSTDVESLAAQFSDLAAIFVFPRFTPQMLMELASQGRTVPAGITRFVIPGRVLRLNAPLDKLAADEPLAVKQEWLDNLIRQKLVSRQVRYYEEPVVLLDE